jgi:hypothetical protein
MLTTAHIDASTMFNVQDAEQRQAKLLTSAADSERQAPAVTHLRC